MVTGRRILVAAAAVWVAGYLAVYFAIIAQQGNSPAWWYVALLVVVIALLGIAAFGRPGRGLLVAAVVLLGFATMIAMLSIGVFLAPALVAAVAAVATSQAATPVT